MNALKKTSSVENGRKTVSYFPLLLKEKGRKKINPNKN